MRCLYPGPFFPGSGLEKIMVNFRPDPKPLLVGVIIFRREGGGGVSLRYTYRSKLMNIYLCCLVQSYADSLTTDAGRIEQQETTEDRYKTSDLNPLGCKCTNIGILWRNFTPNIVIALTHDMCIRFFKI